MAYSRHAVSPGTDQLIIERGSRGGVRVLSDHKRDTALISRGPAMHDGPPDHDWQNERGNHYQMTPIISFVRPSVRFNYTFNLARPYRNRTQVCRTTTRLMTSNSFKRS